jgi:hypothetical protein
MLATYKLNDNATDTPPAHRQIAGTVERQAGRRKIGHSRVR